MTSTLEVHKQRLSVSSRNRKGIERSAGTHCPICLSPKSRFSNRNGRELARCGGCGSLERQRSLVQIWNLHLRNEINVNNGHALLISPARSERMIFSKLGFSSVLTLDIRPEAGCDITADICSMAHVSDLSFDFIFASHVLPHIHDVSSALKEIARILTVDGVFLSYTPVQAGQPTRTFTDRQSIAGWYGEELLQKHNVGTFRTFGDLSLLRDLQRHFVIKTFIANDPISGQAFSWVCAWKLEAAEHVRVVPRNGTRYILP
jgi:SAM-dependent methyltransferase